MIDLRSDTVTRPSRSMRDAAAEATVGDDVFGEDPSVNELESIAAEMVGTQDALLTPSGTMANQIAVLTHTSPAQSVIVERRSHIYGWEGGGLAAHAGVQPITLDGGETGLFTPAQLRAAIVDPEIHRVPTTLVTIENTHNRAGGVAHTPSDVRSVTGVAAEYEIPVHLDGARLFNAAVALDVDPSRLVDPANSAMFSLSKGLGAPVGSILAGPSRFIEEARGHRKRMGGGMRQAGMLAAPATLALRDWQRLEADHRRASRLAEGLRDLPGLAVDPPETNIILVDVSGTKYTAEEFLEGCHAEGVRGLPVAETEVRLCTHRDVDDDDIEDAIAAVARVLD